MPPDLTPEFSRPIRLGVIPPGGRMERIAAGAGERAALAERFGIPAIARLEALLRLRPERGGSIRVTGTLNAEVVQNCVVTLEPVAQVVEAPVDLRFRPADQPLSDDPAGPDELTIEGEAIDLGEAIAEQLALALDPYPRAPDTDPPGLAEAVPPEGDAAPASPFARLAALRKDGG